MPQRKLLGTFSLTLLVIANMIGAAVFTTSGFALQALGSPGRVVAAWIIGGVIALCGAVGYGAAVRRLTASGGEYLFLSHWVHPAAGCAAGWVSLLAGFSGATALAAMAFASYVPLVAGPLGKQSNASLLILFFSLLHAFACGPGVWLQNLMVVGKLLLIALIAGAAVLGGSSQGWQGASSLVPSSPLSWLDFIAQLNWIALSYSGFNAAVYVASEADDAERSVPWAMIGGTLIVSMIYVSLNSIFVFGPPASMVSGHEDVAARAVRYLAGPTWDQVVRGTIGLGLITSVSSLMLAGPRVSAKMADDGVLPKVLANQSMTPVAAIFMQGCIAMVLVWVTTLSSLLPYLGMTLSISAAGTVTAALLCKDHSSSRPTRWIQLAGAVFVVLSLMTAFIAGCQRPSMFAAVLGTLGFGFIYWRMTQRR